MTDQNETARPSTQRRAHAGLVDDRRPPARAAPGTPPSDRAGSPRRRSAAGRSRWAAAIAVVALVARPSAVVVALWSARRPHATVLGYVPSDTVVYGELRLDLPGDQRQASASSSRSSRASPTRPRSRRSSTRSLDRLVADATDGKQTLHHGHQAVVRRRARVQRRARCRTRGRCTADDLRSWPRPARLVLLSIKDEAARPGLVRRPRSSRPAPPTTTETYSGVDADRLSAAGGRQPKAAFAIVDGKVAVRRRPRRRSRPPSTPRATAASPHEPGSKAALGRGRRATTSGSCTSTSRPLIDWSHAGLADARRATGPARSLAERR